MKNFQKFLIIAGILFFGLLGTTKADMIPENSHRYDRCVKITNPQGITGYKLIIWRYKFYYGSTSFDVYEVVKNECLPQHYQGWSTRSEDIPYLVNEKLNIDFLNDLPIDDFEKKLGDFFKLEKINPNGGWISNNSKKTFENIIYSLIQESGEYNLVIVEKESDETGTPKTEKYQTNGKLVPESLENTAYESYFFQFLQSRLTTIILETIALFFLCKLFFKKDEIKNGKIILTGIVASTCTLPILWFVLPNIFHNWTIFAIIGEVFVTIVEVFIIKYMLNIKRWKAIIASVACNLFSVLVGLFL